MNIAEEKAKRQEFCNILNLLSEGSLSDKDVEKQITIYKKLETLYHADNSTSEYRHFYADIFSVFSQLEEDAIEIVWSNLDYIRQEYQPKNYDENGALIDISNNLKKLYDHASLEMARINYIKHIWNSNAQSEAINELGRKLNSHIPKLTVLEETVNTLTENANNAQRDYITILSVFSAVVMVFFSGIGFSSSVLANIHQASIYRIWIGITLLGAVLFNSLWILFNFLREIIDKRQERWKLFVVANSLLAVSLILALLFAYYGWFEAI